MEIVIQDKGIYIDFYVDRVYSARLKTLSPDLQEEKYLIVDNDGRLHDLVLGGLFAAVMKKRVAS